MVVTTFALVVSFVWIGIFFAGVSVYFRSIVTKLRQVVPTTIQNVTAGVPITLVGRVVSPTASVIESPYSKRSCTCFVAVIEQKSSHFDARKGFFDAYWESIGTNMRCAPFLLIDNTGILFVVASRAQMSLTTTVAGELDIQHTLRVVPRAMRWFARRAAPLLTLWVNESLLCDGDIVFVSGTPRSISSLDNRLVPQQFVGQVTHVLRGDDVIVSTTVPAMHIPFYEKCYWFSLASTGIVFLLAAAIYVLF